jgi:hypothetical protein
LHDRFPDQAQSGGATAADIAAAMKGAKITVKGDQGFMPFQRGMADRKWFAKVDGNWKMYFGPLSDSEKPLLPLLQKVTDAMTASAADIEAGKYPDFESAKKAMTAAIMSAFMPGAAGGGATPTPAPAPAPGP